MKATTIKLEDNILKEIRKVKEPSQSVTAFVKDVIAAELRRRKLRTAAEAYQTFLAQNRSESDWLDQWEHASLASDPTDTLL